MNLITNLIILVLAYLGYLLIWFVINLIAYFLSLAFKNPKILQFFVGAAAVIYYIFSFLVGLYLLWLVITLLLSGQILWFFIMIFFGITIIYSVINLLQLPFIFIPAYFLEKLEDMNLEENVARAELLDKEGRVIQVLEGEATINRKMAVYYLALYFVLLSYIFVFPAEREGLFWTDYIINPFFQTLTGTLFIALIYGIYRKLKYKSVFPEDKRLFFIKIWKFLFIVNLIFLVGLFVLSIATGTY